MAEDNCCCSETVRTNAGRTAKKGKRPVLNSLSSRVTNYCVIGRFAVIICYGS